MCKEHWEANDAGQKVEIRSQMFCNLSTMVETQTLSDGSTFPDGPIRSTSDPLTHRATQEAEQEWGHFWEEDRRIRVVRAAAWR